MIVKTIQVNVDSKTWPKGQKPLPELLSSSLTQHIDLGQAFIMLGSLTMPNSLSPASPSRFWAWLRYFIAPALTTDLRITTPFADLDPHQKAILSDDFGVAIAMQWLYDRLGGFAEVVDGRRFLLKFERLLRRNPHPSPKVGPSKAPDFVVRDHLGRWHVLECKGTQSGRGARNQFLRTAIQQKGVITLRGHLRGERLASGLAIAGELDEAPTHLRVIDPPERPDDKPMLELDDTHSVEMVDTARRMLVSNALGRVGLDGLAAELALPSDPSNLTGFLRPSEVKHYLASPNGRQRRAVDQVRERNLTRFRRQHVQYEGRTTEVLVPELGQTARLVVKQGINSDFLRRTVSLEGDMKNEVGDAGQQYIGEAPIDVRSGEKIATLRYGDLFFSEVRLFKK